MAISKELAELEMKISELEIAIEKAQVISCDLDSDYFGMNKNFFIVNYHDKARILNSIAIDYVIVMKKILEEVRRLINIECESAKNEKPLNDTI